MREYLRLSVLVTAAPSNAPSRPPSSPVAAGVNLEELRLNSVSMLELKQALEQDVQNNPATPAPSFDI